MDELLKEIDYIMKSKNVLISHVYVSRKLLYKLMPLEDLIYCDNGRYKLDGLQIVVSDEMGKDRALLCFDECPPKCGEYYKELFVNTEDNE